MRLSRNELGQYLSPDDVVQMVFLRAHASTTPKKWPTRTQIRCWLSVCAQNVLTDASRYYRQQKREGGRRRRQIELLASTMIRLISEYRGRQRTPSSEVAMAEVIDRLERAIDRLSEDRSDAIRMKYFEGLTEVEIAKRMNRSRSAVHALIFKGLRQLWDDRPLKKCVLVS
ncbi:MAG: RNA polymerase sigma factor [Phycisphaerales bacterium]|nr:RNA polymerase sigma factor [Phycisphaerales bacterium]